VSEWIDTLGYGEYAHIFVEKGYTLSTIRTCESCEDLPINDAMARIRLFHFFHKYKTFSSVEGKLFVFPDTFEVIITCFRNIHMVT
jgi:hypothetical protein